jgi:hypothetical protein
MKINKIQRKANEYGIYEVTLTPNWLERIFNFKEKVNQYKDTGSTYTFGGGTVYVDRKGRRLDNGHWIAEAIDRYRKSW